MKKSVIKKKKDSLLSVHQQSEWLTENIRLTAFTKANPETPEKWWESVISGQPTQRITRPFYSDIGPFENGLMQLSIQPQLSQLYRIDWLYTPNPQLSYDNGLPNIGYLDEVVKKFSLNIENWLTLAPPINRLAFGAGLIRPVADIAVGNMYIAKYLKSIQIDDETSSDFLYQINRPRFSKLHGLEYLKINRLSKWSVVIMQGFEFALSGQMLSVSPAEKLLQSECKLEIDINTNPQPTGDLPHNKIKSVFKELVDLGIEITKKGDIK
jgi:hypothetical protein